MLFRNPPSPVLDCSDSDAANLACVTGPLGPISISLKNCL